MSIKILIKYFYDRNDLADQILYLIISWSGSEDDFMNNSSTNKYRSVIKKEIYRKL